MRVIFRSVSFLAALFSVGAFADTTTTIRLRADASYSAKDLSCATGRLGVDFYADLRTTGGELSYLRVSNYPATAPYRWIFKAFDTFDLEKVRLEQIQNWWWFTDLSATERFVAWLLTIANAKERFCNLPDLSGSKISADLFQFELDGVRDSVLISYSTQIRLEGQNNSGDPYVATLRLTQRPSRIQQ